MDRARWLANHHAEGGQTMNAWKPIYTIKERIVQAVQIAGTVLGFALFFSIMVLLA